MQPPQPMQVVRSGPSPPKYGSGYVRPGGLSFRPFEDGHPGAIEGLPYPVRFRRPLQDVIRRTQDPVLRDAQHAQRGLVVPRHLRFPVRQARPRSALPDRVSRDQQRVGVGDGPAAHRAAVQDHHVAEGIDIEEAAQREARPPDPAPDLPVGGRQVLRRPAAAHLHDADAVALLGQPVGGRRCRRSRSRSR